MARRKAKKVDEVVFRDEKADIMLEPDNTFSATVNGQYIKAPTAADVKREVRLLLKEMFEIEWQPVIVVTSKKHDAFNRKAKTVIFEHDRLWMGRTSAGKWMELRWRLMIPESAAENARFIGRLDENFGIPHRDEYSDTIKVYLPYSDEVWEALEEIAAVIDRARGHLISIMQADNVANALLAGGGLALPDGRQEEE